MEELYRRLLVLFAAVGLLVCLGEFENPDVEKFVLTDANLIVRQDAVLEENQIEYAQEVLQSEPDELTPASAEATETTRAPASVSWRVPKLGVKRKPKVMYAATDFGDMNSEPEAPAVTETEHSLTNPLAHLPASAALLETASLEERAVVAENTVPEDSEAQTTDISPADTVEIMPATVAPIATALPATTPSSQPSYADLMKSFSTAMAQPEAAPIRPSELPVASAAPALNNSPSKTTASAPRAPASSTPGSVTSKPERAATALECSLKLESPDGGEILSESIGERILWSSRNAGADIRVKLLKGDQDLGTLTRTRDDGSTLVRIPALVDPDSDYRIRIESVDDPNCFDESEATFSIVP